MSIGAIVTMGYGLPGSASLVVTAGYVSAEAVVPTQAGPFWEAPPASVHFEAPEASVHFEAPRLPGEV